MGLGHGIAHLHIFKAVLLTYHSEDILFATLLHFSCQQQFIKDEVGLLKVEYYVKFANIAVVLVHLFDISMHDFEGDQFIVRRCTSGDEEKRGISAIDNLGVYIVVILLAQGQRNGRAGSKAPGIQHLCTQGSCTFACV